MCYGGNLYREDCGLAKTAAFICPPSWLAPGTKLAKMKEQNLIRVDLTVNRFFRGIGSQFCSIIIDNTKLYSSTRFITEFGEFETDIRNEIIPHDMSEHSRSITNKMARLDHLKFESSDEYYSTNRPLWSDPQGAIEVFHTHAQTYRTSIDHPNNHLIRVCIACSGRTAAQLFYNKGISEATGWVVVNTMEEGKILCDVLNSKPYQFFLNANKWSGWNLESTFNLLPKLDLSRTWTDQELYSHFNLTADEIEYIEGVVR